MSKDIVFKAELLQTQERSETTTMVEEFSNEIYNHALVVAHLLINGVILQADKDMFDSGKLVVPCNNVFTSGTFFYVIVEQDKLELLYRFWQLDPHNGPVAWCIMVARRTPNAAVIRLLDENGWDVNNLLNEFADDYHNDLTKFKVDKKSENPHFGKPVDEEVQENPVNGE